MNTGEFLDKIFAGDWSGYCHVAVGYNGYFEDGSWKFPEGDFQPRSMRWPACRDRVIALAEAEADVYVVPYLLKGTKRAKGTSVHRQLLHADVDDGYDIEQLRSLGAGVVSSGRGVHVYFPLAWALTPELHERFEEALRDYLKADHKIRDNDYLRLPGSFSRKTDPPSLVEVLFWPTQPVDPKALAEKIGLDLTVRAEEKIEEKVEEPIEEPVDSVDMPEAVAAAMAIITVPKDRSGDIFRIAGACMTQGLTLAQARAIIVTRKDLAAKLKAQGDRDDVAQAWAKLKAERERVADAFTPAPPPPPSGADVLDKIETFIRRFCVLPGEHCYTAVTLWAAHTHFIKLLETTPRLACLSPEPGSGKTRVLEVLDVLCAHPLMALDLSMAAFFRIVEKNQPAILLDEVDAIFMGKKQSESAEDMRRVINNGYRVGAVVQRVGGASRDEVQSFHVFTPVAMAGLGQLPDTLMTRSIILRMKRRRGGEKVEPFRDRIHRPAGKKIQAVAAAWAASIAQLDYPELPDGVEDRDADVWEPMIMIADLAGDEWPDRAREACLTFITEKPISTVSLGVRLLTDIRSIWPEDAAVMSTVELLHALHGLDEAPWADLFGEGLRPRKLAQLLGDYGIESHTVRVGQSTPKGYRREDLWDSWLRYVSPEKGNVGNKGNDDGEPVADVSDVADSGTREEETAEKVSEDVSRVQCPKCGDPVNAEFGVHSWCAS